MKKILLTALAAFSLSQETQAQITLINPAGDGGFETGATLAANNWSVAQTSANRVWYAGTAQPGFTGTQSAHIGNSATVLGSTAGARIVHLYRSVTIPAGASNIVLSFKYVQPISDYTYDFMQVFMNGNTPVNGTAQTTGLIATVDPQADTDYATYTTLTYTLSNSLAATTSNLIFTFNADNASPVGKCAIDDVSLTYVMPTCPGPSALSVSGVSSASANVTWVPSGSETAWDLFYGPAPVSAPTATTVPTSTTGVASPTLTGLAPATDYVLYVRAHCSVSDQSPWNGPVMFYTPCQAPTISGITPATRCGVGTATLGATVSAGGMLNWYNAATGGTAIATGSVFTTPVINTTTNYYVSSSSSSPYITSGGLFSPILTNTLTNAPYGEGVLFNATQNFTLNSVDVYPNGPSDDLDVDVYDASYNLLGSFSGTMPAGNGTTPFTVPLNIAIPVGTGYFFEVYTNAGTPLVYNSGASFPYAIGNVGSVTAGYDGFTTYSSLYVYLYNFQVSAFCESARTMVTATVTPPPALTVSTGTTVCANVISTVSITSTASNFDAYTWAPMTNLYTNSGATTPYTGGSATTLYYKSPIANSTSYTISAINNTSGCADVTSTIMRTDVPMIMPVASPSVACSGSTVGLVASSVSSGTAAIGNISTTSVTDETGVTPYSSNWEGAREQYLILASELQASNMNAGNLTSLSFSVTYQGGGSYSQNNFSIKLAHTANASLNSTYGTPTGAFTTVYGPASQGLPTMGLNNYTFATPFNWDGVSNILVDICHDNDVNNTCSGCYDYNSEVAYVTTPFNSVWGSYDDDVQSCGVQASNTIYSDFTSRPLMIFGGQVLNSSGSGLTWQWNPGAINSNTAIVTPVLTGTNPAAFNYTVTGVNPSTTCSNTAVSSVTISPVPSLTVASSTSSLCAGTSASLTATGATTYSWAPAGGSSSVAVVSPAASTIYTVTGSNPGCASTKTISLNVLPSPTVTALASPAVICSGATLTLTANGATTYSWMPNSSTSGTTTASPTVSTVYSVSGTDAGCTTTKTVNVTVNNVPTLTLTTNPASGALCTTGATATLTAAGTSTAYVWSSGANTASTSVAPTSTTVYTVTGTNSCGVKTATAIVNVATTPTISVVTSSTLSCANTPVILTSNATPGVTYVWNTGATTASISVSPSVTTTYTVSGTNACGTATATIVQSVASCVGIEEIAGADAISIYPNPASDLVNISISAQLASAGTVVEVTDAIGKVVIKEILNTNVTTLSISKLEDGIYFFKVSTNNQTVKVGKVVKH